MRDDKGHNVLRLSSCDLYMRYDGNLYLALASVIKKPRLADVNGAGVSECRWTRVVPQTSELF